MYSGYEIVFNRKGEWCFDSSITRNVVFGVENSSSSHFDNHKNNILILDEGTTFEINGGFEKKEKRCSINFTERNTKFCFGIFNFLSDIYLMDLVLLSLQKYL